VPRPTLAGKPLIHVLIPYSTLTGADDHPAELAGYGPIPADLARRIAADGVWKRIITDPETGAVLDHGRTTYRPPAALADYIRARDQQCRAPHCQRPALDSELDHVHAWADGGTTSADNLMTGCPNHHTMKHQPGWQVTITQDAQVTWTTPTGHRYTSNPYDYRPDHDPAPPLIQRLADQAARARKPQPAASTSGDKPDARAGQPPTRPGSPAGSTSGDRADVGSDLDDLFVGPPDPHEEWLDRRQAARAAAAQPPPTQPDDDPPPF
jgi:hypothetical protein